MDIFRNSKGGKMNKLMTVRQCQKYSFSLNPTAFFLHLAVILLLVQADFHLTIHPECTYKNFRMDY